MKYRRTDRFTSDFAGLRPEQKDLFREVAREFSVAADRVRPDWRRLPKSLRVRDVEGHPHIWEMTWEMPDGRATFEWIEIDGEPAVLWRRTGTHSIFRDP